MNKQQQIMWVIMACILVGNNTKASNEINRSGFFVINAKKKASNRVPFVKIFDAEVQSDNSAVQLFRGISTHAGFGIGRNLRFEAIMKNYIEPYDVRGHTDVNEHHLGNNISQFSSWTYSRSNAATCFASEKGGIVVSGLFFNSELLQSPNVYAEKEVLVHGRVINHTVHVIVAIEAKSIFLKKILNHDRVLIKRLYKQALRNHCGKDDAFDSAVINFISGIDEENCERINRF